MKDLGDCDSNGDLELMVDGNALDDEERGGSGSCSSKGEIMVNGGGGVIEKNGIDRLPGQITSSEDLFEFTRSPFPPPPAPTSSSTNSTPRRRIFPAKRKRRTITSQESTNQGFTIYHDSLNYTADDAEEEEEEKEAVSQLVVGVKKLSLLEEDPEFTGENCLRRSPPFSKIEVEEAGFPRRQPLKEPPQPFISRSNLMKMDDQDLSKFEFTFQNNDGHDDDGRNVLPQMDEEDDSFNFFRDFAAVETEMEQDSVELEGGHDGFGGFKFEEGIFMNF